MLTIKRHFPITKLGLSKAWYQSKQFAGNVGPALAAGFASLRDRSDNMGKKSILSSLVVMVGFFGSLSALLILYPIATQNNGPFSTDATRANIESQSGSSTTGTWPKGAVKSETANDQTQGEVPATQSQPIATSPAATPDPAATAPAPAVVPAPSSAMPQAAPLPVMTSPSAGAPVTTSPPPVVPPAQSVPSAPLPTTPLPTVPTPPSTPPSSPLPLDVSPVTNLVPQAVQSTLGGLPE